MPKSPSGKTADLKIAIDNASHSSSIAASPTRKAKAQAGRIVYIECKAGALTGPGRIGRVTFSKTGRTLYYRGHTSRASKAAASSPITAASTLARIIGFPAPSAAAVTHCTAAAHPSRSTKTCAKNIGATSALALPGPTLAQDPLENVADQNHL